MQESLNDLSDGISQFLSALDSAYEGESADHIKSLCTSEIVPLINKAKTKIGNLESILPYVSKIEKLKSDIDGYMSSMRNLSLTNPVHISMRGYYNNLITNASNEIGRNILNIKRILK